MGVHQRRLRRAVDQGMLLRPYPKVFVLAGVAPSHQQQLHVATLATRRRCKDGSTTIGVLSHGSAAGVHGLVPHHPPRPSFWLPRSDRIRVTGIDVRRSEAVDPALDVTMLDGLPVMSRAASICQLAWDSPEQIERAVDEFSRTSSMRWLRETAERYRSHGSRGIGALDRVLDDPRRTQGVTDSWFERVIEALLRHHDLPPIELQHEVVINGRSYRIDIAIPEVLIGVEAHSREFHWGPTAVDSDNIRDLHLGSIGWQLFYVTWWQSTHPAEFVDLLVAAIRSRLGGRLAAS